MLLSIKLKLFSLFFLFLLGLFCRFHRAVMLLASLMDRRSPFAAMSWSRLENIHVDASEYEFEKPFPPLENIYRLAYFQWGTFQENKCRFCLDQDLQLVRKSSWFLAQDKPIHSMHLTTFWDRPARWLGQYKDRQVYTSFGIWEYCLVLCWDAELPYFNSSIEVFEQHLEVNPKPQLLGVGYERDLFLQVNELLLQK